MAGMVQVQGVFDSLSSRIILTSIMVTMNTN